MGLGGKIPPNSQDIFKNLVLKWRPLGASQSQTVEKDDTERGRVGVGGVCPHSPPPKRQEIFENLVFEWCPLVTS